MGLSSLRNPVSLSLLAHALFFFVCTVLMTQQMAAKKRPPLTWVELTQPQPKTRSSRSEEDSVRKHIVQTTPGKQVEKAAKDAFLGEKNQVVDRETVSKSHRISIGQSPTMSQAKAPKESAKTEAEKAEKDVIQTGPLSQFGVPILSHLKRLNQAPAQREPQWATPGQVTEDYVKGLKESERTALNTREYVFFGYYQRIRERLDRAWVPILREKLTKYYRTGRQLASDMDHTTRVLVILNQQGEIVRVQVLSESGSRDLDEAAIRAFNLAGPFPNPPRGIVDPDGQIQVPWEFILRT